MKFIFLLSAMLVLTACGKNGGSSPSENERQEQQRGYREAGTGTTHPDLLNVTLSLPIELTTDRIQFLKSGSALDQGASISCSLNIQEGEIWHYRISGNSLLLNMHDGSSIKMVQQSSIGSGSGGVWVWSGKISNIKFQRRFTLLNGRIVLNQDCES